MPSTPLRRPALLGLGGALASLAVAVPADAAVITTDRSCYNETQPMAIGGAQFAPGTRWSVATEQIFDAGDVDPAGNWLTTNETAPIVPERTTKPKTFTLTGSQDGVPVATTSFDVVNFFVALANPRGRPSGTTRWRFSGFERGKPIYLHVRRGGRTVANVRMGRADSRCGRASVVQRRLPGVSTRRYRTGSYDYYLDSKRTFSRSTRPQYRTSIFISRTFR